MTEKKEVPSIIETELTVTTDGVNTTHYKIKVQSKTDEEARKQFREAFNFVEKKGAK